MRKTIWLVLVAALVVGLVVAVAAGCGRRHHHNDYGGWHRDHRRWHSDHRGPGHNGCQHRNDCGRR